jgi:hypothetical protein
MQNMREFRCLQESRYASLLFQGVKSEGALGIERFQEHSPLPHLMIGVRPFRQVGQNAIG